MRTPAEINAIIQRAVEAGVEPRTFHRHADHVEYLGRLVRVMAMLEQVRKKYPSHALLGRLAAPAAAPAEQARLALQTVTERTAVAADLLAEYLEREYPEEEPEDEDDD